VSSADQAEKCKIAHLLLLVYGQLLHGVFGLEEAVYVQGFNLSSFVSMSSSFYFDKILIYAIFVQICHEAELQAFVKMQIIPTLFHSNLT